MKDRDLLQPGSEICLKSISNNSNSYDRFIITKTIGIGSSSICYQAVLVSEDGTKMEGTLKEFYPMASDIPSLSVNLERRNTADPTFRGQLFSDNSALNTFTQLRDSYKRTYDEMFKAVIRKPDLKLFIPPVTLYKSITENDAEQNFTYYTWVLGDPEMFSYYDFLKKVCVDTENKVNEIKNISLMLNCIWELCKSIDLLHRSALYHLDLTPKNFGIKTYDGKTNTNVSISLYDFNTLYSLDTDSFTSCGTPYFRSPEVMNGIKNQYGIKSDIFSIGTILYFSLVIEETNGKYVNKFYLGEKNGESAFNSIPNDLKESKILIANDDTQNCFLYQSLLQIIKKALNRNDYTCGQYQTIQEIANDIERIITKLGFVISKEDFDKYGEYFLNTNLKTKEEHWNETIKSGAEGAIQRLLFEHPLYDYSAKNDANKECIDILVLGAGTYASKFIDNALELLQIKDFNVNITVMSENSENDKSNYLSLRPEFESFFTVDRKLPRRTNESYGNIEFKNLYFEPSNYVYNKKALLDCCQDKNYSYVFIALNNEELNYNIAKIFETLFNEKKQNIVSYITFAKNEDIEKINSTLFVPVCVKDTLELTDNYTKLEDIAFNIHSIWTKDGISDIDAARSSFYNNKYNYQSSFKNALSIQYKLHSLGYDFNNTLSDREIYEIHALLEKCEVKDELIKYEHRRWNVGQIIDSWRMLEYQEYYRLTSATKDTKSKKHPCLVSSDSPHPLDCLNSKEWDSLTQAEINKLDDLDKVSILMHQYFANASNNVKSNFKKIDLELSVLENLVCINPVLSRCFHFYFKSINTILNDEKDLVNAVNKYRHYYNSISSSLLQYKEYIQDFNLASRTLQNINSILFPIIEFNSYTDWKSKDADMINRIPFALSYSTRICLIMPLSTGTNQSVFQNIASILIINPYQVTYVCNNCLTDKEMTEFENAIDFISKTFEAHNVQTQIELLIVKPKKSITKIKKNTIKARFNRVRRVDFYDFDERDIRKSLANILKECKRAFDEKKLFSILELNKYSDLNEYLKVANNEIFPYFAFNNSKYVFTECEGCNFLRYIPSHAHLFSSDFAENNSYFELNEIIPIDGFERLYSVVAKSPMLWNEICQQICSINNSEIKAIMFYNETEDICTNELEFYLPSFCEKAVDKIAAILSSSEAKIIRNYSIYKCSERSIKIKLFGISSRNEEGFEKMLLNPTALVEPSYISFSENKEGILIKNDSNFKILGFDLSKTFNNKEEKVLEFFKLLSDLKYISNFSINYDTSVRIDFTFSTAQAKELMTKSNCIIDMFIYERLVESCFFDDGACYENVSAKEFKNTWFVATKGYNSVFLACVSNENDLKSVNHTIEELFDEISINSKIYIISINRNFIISEDKLYQNDKHIKAINQGLNTDFIDNIITSLKSEWSNGLEQSN